MRITVAIACCNLEERIALCLNSVIDQDFQDLQILVVDDCSSDNSVEVVKGVMALHPERNFKLIVNPQNLGLSAVRNICIDEAEGEALFFMDGDDTIEAGTLSLFHKRMATTGVEVVCGSFRKTDDKGNVILTKQFPDDTVKGPFAYASYIEKHINGFFWLPIWNNLYSLHFLRAHNIRCASNYRKHEGSLFTLQVAFHAQSVSYLNQITYNWINLPSSITNTISKNKQYLIDLKAVIVSVVDAKNNFVSMHHNIQLPDGLLFLVNYIILTQGLLKLGLLSENIEKKEKKHFLRWLRSYYRKNNLRWSNIVGPFNKISYLILLSPCPYSLFRLYFKHLKTIAKVVNLRNKSNPVKNSKF